MTKMHRDELFPNLAEELLKSVYDGETVPSSFAGMTDGDIKNLDRGILNVHKVGMKLPMTWEALAGSERKGHYEPVGNKYAQWMSWWIGKQVFRFWRFTENRLQKFRSYSPVSGYEWEDAEYREFKRKRKWVEDGED